MSVVRILGVRFFRGNANEAVEKSLHGGLVVVPSAPVLVDMADRPTLREALLDSDLAITDSGLMVLLWRLLKREKLERVSGLEYLKLLLEELRKPETGRRLGADGEANLKPEGFDPKQSENLKGSVLSATTQVSGLRSQVSNAGGRVFWVMPTVAARDQNLAWLRSQGFETTADDCYVAPMYEPDGPISDQQLFAIIQQRKPAHIIMALGGGVQERLGFALKQSLASEGRGQRTEDGLQAADVGRRMSDVGSYRPGIHCIGAAIGFLSGEQVKIPMWVDYFYLGWLWRSVSAPTKFVPRYWKATRLVWLMIRYGAKAPVAAS